MQSNEVTTSANPQVSQTSPQIASWKHFVGFLLIGAGLVALGVLAQNARTGSGSGSEAGQLGLHNQAIHVYLGAILADWALLYYCWTGVRRCGGNLTTLSGVRWTSRTSVAQDFAIALPFWVLWEATGYGVHRILGPSGAKSLDTLLPQTFSEILVWIATSITAGICEEMAFRGYVQRQFQALTGSVSLAVLGQGIVFGLFHSYQGWENAVVISILGMLFGVLAAWRRNLRANIVVHAWADIWSGWLRFIVLR